jgi:hypothetical protein
MMVHDIGELRCIGKVNSLVIVSCLNRQMYASRLFLYNGWLLGLFSDAAYCIKILARNGAVDTAEMDRAYRSYQNACYRISLLRAELAHRPLSDIVLCVFTHTGSHQAPGALEPAKNPVASLRPRRAT